MSGTRVVVMSYVDEQGKRHVTDISERDLVDCINHCEHCEVGCVFKNATFVPDVRRAGSAGYKRSFAEKYLEG